MAPATRPAPYFTGGFAKISQAALRGRFTAVAKHQGGLTALFFTGSDAQWNENSR